MKTIKGFANYGVLAHEKETIFTISGKAETAAVSEKIEITIPSEYKIAESAYGDILIDIPGAGAYPAQKVISSKKSEPVLRWYDGKEHSVKLDWKEL